MICIIKYEFFSFRNFFLKLLLNKPKCFYVDFFFRKVIIHISQKYILKENHKNEVIKGILNVEEKLI